MKIQNKQPRKKCTEKNKTTSAPCGSWAIADGKCWNHGGRKHGGAPEDNQNAVGHGAPEGNQNARKHGLFAKSLSPEALEVYEAAKSMPAAELARDTAEFLVAKVAEAFRSDGGFEAATGVVREILAQLVDAERITPGTADALAAKLMAPDLGTLGKVLSPLKGLLEVKKQDEESKPNPGGEDGDTVAVARRILEELVEGDARKRGREA